MGAGQGVQMIPPISTTPESSPIANSIMNGGINGPTDIVQVVLDPVGIPEQQSTSSLVGMADADDMGPQSPVPYPSGAASLNVPASVVGQAVNAAEGKAASPVEGGKEAKGLLSQLIRHPLNYDWEAQKRDLPRLNGYRIGTTNSKGRISFDPMPNYQFPWPELGFYEAGWEGVIIDSGVKGGVFEFTVEFTKGDQRPVTKI